MTEATIHKAIRLTFPWPDSRLSPNARTHWRKLAEVKASAKRTAWIIARSSGVRIQPDAEAVTMTVTFCPPNKRRRDKDNAIASCKALMDGLSLALGVDDSQFAVTYAPGWGEVVKGGAVIVEIPG